jgi:hypothetical protein
MGFGDFEHVETITLSDRVGLQGYSASETHELAHEAWKGRGASLGAR